MKWLVRLGSVLSLLSCASCYRAPRVIEPTIATPSHPKEIVREGRRPLILPEGFSTSPFAPLSLQEEQEEWGKEYLFALSCAADFDLYRAVTFFKRALFLLPQEKRERRLEIEYSIALSYYLGKKYVEVVYEVESSELMAVDRSFPAFRDLLIILYDSYDKLCRINERDHILSLIESDDCETGEKLSLLQILSCADFPTLAELAKKKASVETLLDCYCEGRKSVQKAEMLNAMLPGSGYWYVGQKQTAITAFLINALFIGAAVIFFEKGNAPAGIITLSLESGWYFGGIYGAGLAAKYHNERLYECCVQKLAEKECLFPLMRLNYTF